MTVLAVAVKYLRGRFVPSGLTVLSVALGVTLLVASLLLTRSIREGFIEGTTDYGLVVGAKGSPTQLVLNVVFRMDLPTPNIVYSTYRRLLDDARVEGFVAVHTITTIHYLLTEHLGRKKAAAALLDVLRLVRVVPVDHDIFRIELSQSRP